MLIHLLLVASLSVEPKVRFTPGSTSKAVTQSNINKTICVSGYSTKVRPSVSYTDKIKKMTMNQYGYDWKDKSKFELDHLISLELGGNPTDPRNLWPEPWLVDFGGEELGAHAKDKLENELHKEVCTGQTSLRSAQEEISKGWVKAYRKRFGGK